MSLADAHQQLAEALEALSHAQEQMRDLLESELGNVGAAPSLAATLADLTPDAIDHAIDTLLESSAGIARSPQTNSNSSELPTARS